MKNTYQKEKEAKKMSLLVETENEELMNYLILGLIGGFVLYNITK